MEAVKRKQYKKTKDKEKSASPPPWASAQLASGPTRPAHSVLPYPPTHPKYLAEAPTPPDPLAPLPHPTT